MGWWVDNYLPNEGVEGKKVSTRDRGFAKIAVLHWEKRENKNGLGRGLGRIFLTKAGGELDEPILNSSSIVEKHIFKTHYIARYARGDRVFYVGKNVHLTARGGDML